MSDFIKRSDAVEYVMSILDVNKYYHPHSKSRNVPIDEVVDRINQVPAADLSGWKRIVFCGECDHTQRTDDHEIWCTGRGSPCQLVAPDGFCDKGKARVQEAKHECVDTGVNPMDIGQIKPKGEMRLYSVKIDGVEYMPDGMMYVQKYGEAEGKLEVQDEQK